MNQRANGGKRKGNCRRLLRQKVSYLNDRSTLPIAVFDSGMGGVSVLRELYRLMPEEDYLFFGDSANAPYGGRSAEEVCALTLQQAEKIVLQGIKALVIACNTATSAAIIPLRERYPHIPVVGLEPAVKPAVEAHPGGRILILATELTISQEKCQALIRRFAREAELIPQSAPGLADFVERNELHSQALRQFLRRLLSPYREEPVDAVVLGCTHYPFVATEIAAVLGGVPCYDGGAGTAREVRALLEQAGLCQTPNHRGQVTFRNSDPSGEHLRLSRELFYL